MTVSKDDTPQQRFGNALTPLAKEMRKANQKNQYKSKPLSGEKGK